MAADALGFGSDIVPSCGCTPAGPALKAVTWVRHLCGARAWCWRRWQVHEEVGAVGQAQGMARPLHGMCGKCKKCSAGTLRPGTVSLQMR